LAEWSKALVLKTSDGQPSQGSNPCPSAIIKKGPIRGLFYCSVLYGLDETPSD
jgi:hypothetical protein